MHTVVKIYEECWDVTVFLVWPIDEKELMVFLKATFPDDDLSEVDEEPYTGCMVDVNGEEVVIALSRWDGSLYMESVVSHECVHAAAHMLTRSGVTLEDSDEEPLAHLQASLFRRCMAVLRDSA